MQFNEGDIGGLGVMLQYMSTSGRGEWTALRTVADLSITTAAERSRHPLLKMTLTCDGMQRRRPLLAAMLSELGGGSRAVTPAVTAGGRVDSAARYPLVRALVEQCVTEGQKFAALHFVAAAAESIKSDSPKSEDPLPAAYRCLNLALRCTPHAPLLSSLVHTVVHSKRPPLSSIANEDEEVSTSQRSRNISFVFIKPHACTDAVRKLVESRLQDANMRIEQKGIVRCEDIDERGLIDQHYAAIARYATKWTSADIPMSQEGQASFRKAFNVEWATAVESGRVLNASQAAQWFGCKNGEALAEKWNTLVSRTKLGPGLYVGYHQKDDLYVINGFYLRNREKFTAPGGRIEWYVVSWDEQEMPWKAFRADFVGSTDPTAAPNGSLRAAILRDWKTLGLAAMPNVSDNGVHASAGPMEGLAERMIWLQRTTQEDPFGRRLQAAGVSVAMVRQLCENPEVTLQIGKQPPAKGLTFDLLEDVNSSDVVESVLHLDQARTSEVADRNAKNLPVTSAVDILLHGRTDSTAALRVVEGVHRTPSNPSIVIPSSVLNKEDTKPAAVAAVRPQPPAPPQSSQVSGSSIRLRQTGDGRPIASPYIYAPRGNGVGLATVFRNTIASGAAPRRLGLGLLHDAVLHVKRTSEVDPYGRVVAEPWPTAVLTGAGQSTRGNLHDGTTTYGSMLNRSTALSTVTAREPQLKPLVAADINSTAHATNDIVRHTEVSPRTRRLTTADRIRRRTQKLQAEVEGIERRREERVAALLHHSPHNGGGTTPRKPAGLKTGLSPRVPQAGPSSSPGGPTALFQVRGDRLSLRGNNQAPLDGQEGGKSMKTDLLRAAAVPTTSKSPVLTTLTHRGPTTSTASIPKPPQ